MQELSSAVRQVLFFHPHVVRNYGHFTHDEPQNPTTTPVSMAVAAEFLVAQLVSVLSQGLSVGVELWSVLETLERVPNKIRCEKVDSPSKQALNRLKFSGQIIYVIKSAFTVSTAAARARALLRLALNQGLLLASLELIARWNKAELATFYADPAVSVLCNVDEQLWDSFLRACAPIAGVTLADIEAGVSKEAFVVKFDLKLTILDGTDGNSDYFDNNGKGRDDSNVVPIQHVPVNGCVTGKQKRVARQKKNDNDCKKIESVGAASEVEKEDVDKPFSQPPHLCPLEAVKVDLLLDRAEALLFLRWDQLSVAISACEALLFENEDTD